MSTSKPIDENTHNVIRGGLLNPGLDVASLALAFSEKNRIQVESVLRPEVAEILYGCLHNDVPWSYAFRDRSGPRKLWAEEVAALGAQERAAIEAEIEEVGETEFQFAYDSYMMVTAYKDKRDLHLPLHRVIEQINAAPWLQFMRELIGEPGARRSDAQATRYTAGHFLKDHNDVITEDKRLAAYVINLSKDWEAHNGGLLQFTDEAGEIEETLMPRFNTLSVFKVPMAHHVSPVGRFVTGSRYAITGWVLI